MLTIFIIRQFIYLKNNLSATSFDFDHLVEENNDFENTACFFQIYPCLETRNQKNCQQSKREQSSSY